MMGHLVAHLGRASRHDDVGTLGKQRVRRDTRAQQEDARNDRRVPRACSSLGGLSEDLRRRRGGDWEDEELCEGEMLDVSELDERWD